MILLFIWLLVISEISSPSALKKDALKPLLDLGSETNKTLVLDNLELRYHSGGFFSTDSMLEVFQRFASDYILFS